MPDQRRMKLSDVEAATTYFLPRNASFAKSHPTIKSIRAEIEEVDAMWGRRKAYPTIYTETNIVPNINCSNPRCYGGGLKLDDLLRWTVVYPKLTHFESTMSCCGYEGSPKGRRKTGSCDTRFRIKIDVEYQDEPASSLDGQV